MTSEVNLSLSAGEFVYSMVERDGTLFVACGDGIIRVSIALLSTRGGGRGWRGAEQQPERIGGFSIEQSTVETGRSESRRNVKAAGTSDWTGFLHRWHFPNG
jgi:hypothetical protein